MKTKLIRLGNLTLKAHRLDQHARQLRNQLREVSGSGFYTSTALDEAGTELTISVKLPLYLQVLPDAKPLLHVFEICEGRDRAYARLHYPRTEIGLCANKKTRLFIDAWSESFDPPKPA